MSAGAAFDVRYEGYERHRTPEGVELAYKVQGIGPVLVVLPSLIETSTTWRAFARRSARRYRVVLYDLRSMGRSSDAEPSYEGHLADLESLLDAVGADEAILMGQSISTQLCAEFALAHPDRTRALVLLGPMVHRTGIERRRRILESWLGALDANGTAAMFSVFWPQIFSDGYFERLGAAGYEACRELWEADTALERIAHQLRSAIAEQARPPALEQVACPTLLLAGEDDFVGTEGALRAAAETLPEGRVARLRGAGHVPQLEATADLHRAIDAFVDSLARAPATPPA